MDSSTPTSRNFTAADAAGAVEVLQHAYAITSRTTFDGKPSSHPLLYTVGVQPCVSIALCCDDAIGTTLLAHFSAHAKGTDAQLRSCVKDSLHRMLKDAGVGDTTSITCGLMGGYSKAVPGWKDGRSEKLAAYVVDAIQEIPNATILENRLFEGVQQMAVDARTQQIFYGKDIIDLFLSTQDTPETLAHSKEVRAHRRADPCLPLMKHYRDGRSDHAPAASTDWSEKNPKRDPLGSGGAGWVRSIAETE